MNHEFKRVRSNSGKQELHDNEGTWDPKGSCLDPGEKRFTLERTCQSKTTS